MPTVLRMFHCPACRLPHPEDRDYHETPEVCRRELAASAASADAYWAARIEKKRQEALKELAVIDARRAKLLAAAYQSINGETLRASASSTVDGDASLR